MDLLTSIREYSLPTRDVTNRRGATKGNPPPFFISCGTYYFRERTRCETVRAFRFVFFPGSSLEDRIHLFISTILVAIFYATFYVTLRQMFTLLRGSNRRDRIYEYRVKYAVITLSCAVRSMKTAGNFINECGTRNAL